MPSGDYGCRHGTVADRWRKFPAVADLTFAHLVEALKRLYGLDVPEPAPGSLVRVASLRGTLDVQSYEPDAPRAGRIVVVSDNRKGHTQVCRFDPTDDADFDQAVRDAISYLENPQEHTEEFPR